MGSTPPSYTLSTNLHGGWVQSPWFVRIYGLLAQWLERAPDKCAARGEPRVDPSLFSKRLGPCQRLTGPGILGTLAWRKSRAVGAHNDRTASRKKKWSVTRIPGPLVRPRTYGQLLPHYTVFLIAPSTASPWVFHCGIPF